jgi:hypothetical protein
LKHIHVFEGEANHPVYRQTKRIRFMKISLQHFYPSNRRRVRQFWHVSHGAAVRGIICIKDTSAAQGKIPFLTG